MPSSLPVLYPILDASILPASPEGRATMLRVLVAELLDAGVSLLQYRNKQGSDAEILADCAVLRDAVLQAEALNAAVSQPPSLGRCRLILNDRASLVAQTRFDGVHVGQEDISPSAARALVGPDRIVGVSTHSVAQLKAADLMPVDYIAIGPVFATASKEKPDPVVGLEGVRLAHSLTTKPVVAIGGITPANCGSVREAGADCVAAISALFASASGRPPGKTARDFFAKLR